MLDKYLGEAAKTIGDPTAADWPPESLKCYDDMTLSTLFRERGASPDAIALLRVGYLDLWGDGADSNSVLHLLRDRALNHGAPEFWAIKGGTDLLPRAFAAHLHDKMRYGAAITRFEQDRNGVRVIYTQDGRLRTMSADYLICTIPFPVLRHMEAEPKFSPGKQKAIAELPYASVVRVYLQAKKRFWDDKSISGATGSDLPIGLMLNTTQVQPGVRGILEAYICGKQGKK